jgi:hypothetical protein
LETLIESSCDIFPVLFGFRELKQNIVYLQVMKPTAKKRKQNIEEKFFTTCIKALNDEDEGDECAIVGKNIATELRKMDFHQQI